MFLIKLKKKDKKKKRLIVDNKKIKIVALPWLEPILLTSYLLRAKIRNDTKTRNLKKIFLRFFAIIIIKKTSILDIALYHKIICSFNDDYIDKLKYKS